MLAEMNPIEHTWSPLVLLDLETTGLSREEDEVIQIAACMESDPSVALNFCMLPAKDIPAEVTALTGFAKDGASLTLRGRRVDTVTRAAAVQAFLDFLTKVRGSKTDKLILVAHNAFGFDADFLLSLFGAEDRFAPLAELVEGFSDTLPVFRDALPLRPRAPGSFKLATLAEDFMVLDGVGPLHNADQDVIVLKRLIDRLGVAKQLVSSARALTSFSAYGKIPKSPSVCVQAETSGPKVEESDEDMIRELRAKLPVIKTLEKAAKQVTKKLPEIVESAGWTTNFYVGQLEDKENSLSSAREELEDMLGAEPAKYARAQKDADEALSDADHMPDWLLLVEDTEATWMMEVKGSRVWKGTFKVSMYDEAGHPALFALLEDGVLLKQNPRKCGSLKEQIERMEELEQAAREIKDPLEQQFMHLEFYRNKREADLLVGGAQHITATRKQVEEVLQSPTTEMLRDTKELVEDTLQRDQYLADWLHVIADKNATVSMEVRRGADVWVGKQAMKDFTYAGQVLLFDVMHGGDVVRQ